MDEHLTVNLEAWDDGFLFWTPESFGADQEGYYTFTTVDPTGQEMGLLLKAQSSTSPAAGVLEVLYSAPAEEVQVWTYTPGQSWSLWDSAEVVFGLWLRGVLASASMPKLPAFGKSSK